MEESKKLLDKHTDEYWRCARCSLCKWPPLAQIKSAKFSSICCSMDYGYFHPWSGGGKIVIGASLYYDRVRVTEEVRDTILQCTLCGACDASCKYSTDLEVLDTIFDVRQHVVEKIGPHPAHKKYADAAEKYNNPYGEPHENRQEWINKTSAKSNPNSKTLFFTGCTASYRQQDMAQASVEILNAIDYEFQVSMDEICCGSPIYRSGQVGTSKKYIQSNIELFNRLGIEEIITACPGCYAMFVAEYPHHLDENHFEMWKKIKFRHMVEIIEEAIRKKNIEFEESDKKPIITYHDPCHLGRGAEPYVSEWKGTKKKVYNQITVYDPPKIYRRGGKGVYDAPRNIFKRMNKTLEFVEMFRINEYAYCCGSGGGVKAAYPEMAMLAATNRLEEAEFVLNEASKEKNVEKIIVSACPFCKTNFENGLLEAGKDIQYKDINQLVLELMKK